MYDFLTYLTNITGLGKRKSPEHDQEVSPAKRSRAAARQLAGMPNAGQRLKTSSHELPSTGRQSADVTFTAVAQQPAEPKAQQQLHLGRPAHHADANLHQNQHSQQQQQQQMNRTRQLQELDSSAYDRVKQKLERPPAGSTALRHRAAQARPADSKHMPVPSQLMAAHKQDHAVHRGTPGHRPAFFRTAQRSSSPQQTWRLSPAEVGAAFRSSVRKQDGYGAYGLAPPPQQQQQQQHQQQQQRLAQRPYQPPAPILPAAAQRFHRDWGRRSGYGRAAAAGTQHTAPGLPAAAAAVAAGAAGRAATGVMGASPPLQDVRQRLSYGGAAEVDAALLPVTAYGLPERGATAGPSHGRSTATAAADAEAAGAGAPDRAVGGAAAGAGAGAGASTPPASFAAVYQETVMSFSGMDPELAAAEAKIVAKLARAQADYKKAQQSKKEAAGRAQRLDHDISRAMYQRAADYQPYRSVPAVQLLEAEASAREQQRLQHQAELHQQRQLNQLRHQELLAAAVKVPPPESMVSHRHEQQQQEQQQQQEEEEDVVVIDVSSEEAGDHSDQQQYQNGTDDFTYPDEQAEGSASGGDEVSSEGDEAEGDDEASQERESEEEQEVDQAAEGIHALGISAWMGPRANWSVTQQQMTRFNQATAGAGSDHEILASHERASLELMRADLATMRPGEWLNDECMNMYMALLQDRDAADRANGGLCCHFFNTFFLNKLYMDANDYNYKNVRRWTMPARLKTAGQASDCVLKCDRVIIPVHQGLHWTALMVDIKQQRLVFFDSLFGKNAKAVAAVRRWVADEAQDKLKVTWDTSGWEEVYPTDIPQQQNGFDCGVFALMFCNRMGLKGGAFDFRQQDISVNVRVAITCDLLDGAIKATARKT